MKVKSKVLLLLLSLIMLTLFGGALLAKDVRFEVYTELPENQIDRNVTFFDLSVEPGLEQTLTMKLVNNSDDVLYLDGVVTDAWTTMNGEIDYSPTDNPKDDTLPLTMGQVLTLNETEIELQPRETKTVTATLKIPENFEVGTHLGGIDFIEKITTEDTSNTMNINNKYAVVKGVRLTYGTPPEPSLEISKAGTMKYNRKPAVIVNVQETAAASIYDMSFEAKVRKKGQSDILLEYKSENIDMAPHSNTDIPVYWKEKTIEPGDYQIDVKVTSGEKQWSKTLDFTVDAKQSKTIENAENPVFNGYWILAIVIVILAIIIITLIILIVRKNKKTNNQNHPKDD